MASASTYGIERYIANVSAPPIGPPDHVNCKSQAEVDEAILNDIVSGGSGQSSRQASRQTSQGAPIKMLTRPVSSGRDPAAGFSFTKAKPMQQFDFRRPKQINIVEQPQEPPLPSNDIPTEVESIQSPPRWHTSKAGQDAVSVASNQGLSPKHHSTSGFQDPLPVPFPNAKSASLRASDPPRSNRTSGPIRLDFSSISVPPLGVSAPANDALTNSSLDGTNESHPLDLTLPNHNQAATTPLAPGNTSAETVRDIDQPQVDVQSSSRKFVKDHLTSVASAPKITKSRRRKTQTGTATNGPPLPLNPKEAYTEDDLLKLLMYRRWQGQQELEDSKATQHQKEAEIQTLSDMNDDLAGQLREAVLRDNQTTADLSKFKTNKSTLESKVKRLSAFVTGLTNDNKRLREDVEDSHKHQQDFSVANKELRIRLEEAQKLVEQERIKFQQVDSDARHKIETLAQTIEHQTTQLRNDEKLVMDERDRSNRLNDQISRITASHEQLLEVLAGSRDSITCKIDNLLDQAQSTVPPNTTPKSDSDDAIRPMLEQCVQHLQTLLKADTAKPEDLQKLNRTIDSFVEGSVSFVSSITTVLIRGQDCSFRRSLRGEL